ncbi:MAG: hypothetical protein J7576_11485 [Siphonobacter aquaeclarae]|nr:hypothetical protein [Siphonobacter aquaeclarae]
MSWITALFSFVRQDGRRFLIEIVVGVLLAAFSWLAASWSEGKALKGCQDERAALLRETRKAQSLQDSIFFARQLAAKEANAQKLNEEIFRLREKIALDSVSHFTELESMRAINARYRAK